MTHPLDRGEKTKKVFSPLFILQFLAACFALAVLATVAWGLWLWSYAASPGPLSSAQGPVHVYIPARTTFSGIEKILTEQGVIRKDRRFFHLARYLKLTQKLKAGEYLFTPGQTPSQVLRLLEAGSTVHWPVTIPEGSNIYQIADILAAGNWAERQAFLDLVRDPQFLARFGIEAASLEGYLFPDTYNLMRGQSLDEIVGMMVRKGKEVRAALGDLGRNELGLTPHEVLTLASIVEKETATPEERPLIARVFLNRLERGMRLQTDPTVIYGLTDFDGNLTRKDLRHPTPYNTYVVKGLPPGPIANPGREAVAAVLHPARESYLYFVSKNDGSHHFSKTLAEHNRAVRKYQKRRKR